jgi:hypothetical protein
MSRAGPVRSTPRVGCSARPISFRMRLAVMFVLMMRPAPRW